MPGSIASLSCLICDKPVRLETAKTDEFGNAVHEECYVLSISWKLGQLVFRGLSTAFRRRTLSN
jgi:hypothetical protein